MASLAYRLKKYHEYETCLPEDFSEEVRLLWYLDDTEYMRRFYNYHEAKTKLSKLFAYYQQKDQKKGRFLHPFVRKLEDGWVFTNKSRSKKWENSEHIILENSSTHISLSTLRLLTNSLLNQEHYKQSEQELYEESKQIVQLMAELEGMELQKYETFGEYSKASQVRNDETLNYTPFRKKKKQYQKSRKGKLFKTRLIF